MYIYVYIVATAHIEDYQALSSLDLLMQTDRQTHNQKITVCVCVCVCVCV